MKKAICNECNHIMKTQINQGEKKYFCKYCDDYTKYQIKDVINFCDQCGEELEVVMGCGSLSFFCHNCNELRSKRVVKTKYFDLED